MNYWYLIQFKPNSHFLAQRNLNRQGYLTFLPMNKSTMRKASRFVNNHRPLFPGYMFIKVNPDLAPWRSINSTIGVSRIVSFQGKPKTVPLQLISELMFRCDEEGIILPPKILSKGDSVELLTGPFTNFVATIETIDPEQRIWVLMDFMGQSTRIKVSPYHLKKIN